ncbi:hypothetical protein NQ314_010683 [Rhamnusium bicolor]|uniref:G-protein coupled receptors family 2 profile 2 domain-containing protein n=1 Tax=Rhamnusium bicolor TaxID=1586634 RepID=A0AAV8XPW3_9CUCU|nr:hypothetical protein NQ314_010683 [Rhamnusium bicolor]
MCIDIWLAFSGLRGFYGRENMEKTLYTIFRVYAWGSPSLIVLFLFVFNTYGNQNSSFYPGIGVNLCFLSGHLQILLYYFGPILLLVVINTVLFILTAINIQKVKKETSMLQDPGSRRYNSRDDEKK